MQVHPSQIQGLKVLVKRRREHIFDNVLKMNQAWETMLGRTRLKNQGNITLNKKERRQSESQDNWKTLSVWIAKDDGGWKWVVVNVTGPEAEVTQRADFEGHTWVPTSKLTIARP
jgi:hypothetical protein